MTEEEELLSLKQKIERDRGFRCDLYKDKCLRRRLHVRMRARSLDSFSAYAALLDSDPSEYDRLLDALTINVTKFFRNREMWDVLGNDILTRLFQRPDDVLRVWSAGCASGEEPYSIAMLMREWAERHGSHAQLERVRILGTDIDRASLIAAERAIFPELSMEETPATLRERWFSEGPPFALAEPVRRMAAFGRSDLLSDPPPSGQSMIMCRNVIIYFERAVQERLFETFYDALEPGGFLVLGRVESLVGPMRSKFRTVSTRERIYMKPDQ